VERLLDVFGFLTVLLHGLTLTAQALVLGGIGFLLWLAVPLAPRLGAEGGEIQRRSQRLLNRSASALALVALLTIALKITLLTESLKVGFDEAMTASFALAGLTTTVVALMVAMLNQRSLNRTRRLALVVCTVVLIAAAVSVTHAIARLDHRFPMAVVGGLHQLGAGLWIGGMPYFLLTLARCQDGNTWRLVGKRFSQLSMAGVALIGGAGLIMVFVYIGDWSAIYGTAYGLMTSTKALIFLCLLGLGFANYRSVERLRRDPNTPILRLRRFAEVELGVGITVFFVAASLTSLPPAVDLVHDRATWEEIVERVLTPKMPSLTSPEHADLAIPALQSRLDAEAIKTKSEAPAAFIPGAGVAPPRNAFDVAWSEYNHHWAGIFVLVVGFMALLDRLGIRWARHWPLVFAALSIFLIIRSDPETWPLGDIGFLDSLRDPEVAQHRLLVSLVGVFGILEWRVRVGGLANTRAAYVFPFICAVGGGLLLSHSHALANIRDQLLIEITHTPLALVGATAGWARWVELRSEGALKESAAWIWPFCFIIVGLTLLLYREV
jgi:putative copper resistance protein D